MSGPVQSAVGGRIAVVGCSECQYHWLVEHSSLALQETITCPQCGYTRQSDTVRSLAKADTREQAAELRSRILASRADQLESYQQEQTYAEQAEKLDFDLGPDVGESTTAVTQSILDDSGGLFIDWFEHDLSTGTRSDRLEEAAENIELPGYPTIDEKLLSDPFGDVGTDPSTGELVFDSTQPADHISAITLEGGTTATGLWTALLDGVGERLLSNAINSLQKVYDRVESHTFSQRLAEIGVPQGLWAAVEAAVRDDDHVSELLGLMRRVATQRQDVSRLYGLAHLLGWQYNQDIDPPTLVVHPTERYLRSVEQGTRDNNTIDRLARLLEHLGHSLEIVVTASPVDCRKLCHLHGHRNVNRRWTGRQDYSDIDAVAEQVLVDYDRDSTELNIIRTLAHDDTRALSYATLADEVDVSRQRLSQIIPETDQEEGDKLEARNLVTTHRGSRQTQVEITPYGRRVTEKLAERDRKQTTLTEASSETLQSSSYRREAPSEDGGGGGEDPRRKGSGLAQVQRMSSWRAAQLFGARTSQGVAVVDAAIQTTEDCREADLWIDKQKNAVAVSCEYTNPMQWTLSTARALSHPRTLGTFVGQSQADMSDFDDLFEEHRQLLRSSTCLGYLPDRLDNLSEFVAILQKARDELQELSGDLLRAKEQEDRSEVTRLYGQITREALGLSSTIIAVLDLLDIEVIREIRVPEFSREFDAERWDNLTAMVGKASAIQSRKGLNTLYRQLYEQREAKQEWSVDLDDTESGIGNLMGSWVICGDFGNHDSKKRQEFVDSLRDRLREPQSVREDAPEVGAQIPFEAFESGREAVRRAARWLCVKKGYAEPSATVVSVLQLYTGGAYDTARCLNHLQSAESINEELDVRELRYAISHLDVDRIIPTESRAVGRIIRTLLRVDEPLGSQELADQADVARSTLTRNRGAGDRLQGLGLLTRTDDGRWRVQLPINPNEERSDVLPALLVDDTTTAVRDVLGDVAFHCADACRLSDPTDPITSPWLWDSVDGPDCRPLLDEWEWLRPWISTLADVLGHSPEWWDKNQNDNHVLLGIIPDQARLGIYQTAETAAVD